MKAIKIEIPSLPENIRMIESFIDNAKEEFQLEDDIYGNIMIAVTEAVNNAIVHGNGNDTNKNVALTLQILDHRIKFTVQDQGNGFDYSTLPDPTSPENLTKPGGRGIFLMKNLCDQVSFKDNGKVVELDFYMS
ncbi:ATP-binding protein [Fulvivirga sedimenti]|jgi:serine/threonine-protein kinase RsbW|uniref:ATP-binding protein n=1 Tax=Fulvivirga sedimenti TaxID=2879465 RepID=A0A9X1HWT7_9BACT|nr:ATP-binding protein [Fulvivirga sedimenti]MCA6078518.1 ATP-binding protein [Fulvivirga sedimenti]